MIEERSVLRMKVPYPSINDQLAVSSHMYVCQNADDPEYSFVKCQTLKPYMMNSNIISHYCDEKPDVKRNPFQRMTRIDCDKLFSTSSVSYDDRLKTSIREDVCEELFDHIVAELMEDGYLDIALDEKDLVKINPLISPIGGLPS